MLSNTSERSAINDQEFSKISNLETNLFKQSPNDQESNEVFTKIKTEVEEKSNQGQSLSKMRKCRVILRDIRHDTQKNESGTTQEVKHEPDEQFLIILSPKKTIIYHKPIKIEEGDVDDSETDKLQCEICMKKFRSVDLLKRHKNIHNKKFGCKICDKKYVNNYKLLKHIENIHENPGSFNCEICSFTFNRKETLASHQRLHNKNRPKPFECNKCCFTTHLKQSLNLHLKTHVRKIVGYDKSKTILQKNRIHDCKYCGKKFMHKISLLKHIKMFHAHEIGRPFYKCDICGSIFYRKIYLMYHMEAKHPDGKLQLFTCDLDGKIFNYKKRIDQHMKCHLLPLKCDFCHRKLNVISIKAHIKNFHTGNKQIRKKYNPKPKIFKCLICLKMLASKQSLDRHISSHNKNIKCKFCGKLFGTQSRLKYHIRDYHENPNNFSCKICGQKFAHCLNLKAHDPNRPQNLKCSQCDFAIDNKVSFKNHFYFHKKNHVRFALTKKSHKCPQCPVVKRTQSSLNWHIYYVHTKILIECDICERKVKSKKSMFQHFKLAHKIEL